MTSIRRPPMLVLDVLWAIALFVVPAAAMVAAPLRRPAGAVLALTAAASAAAAVVAGGATATLDVTHWFAAFEGSDITSKAFVVDHARAPAWCAPALAAAWAGLWAGWALRPPPAEPHPYLPPLLLAWGGSALVLGMERLAGPATLAMGLGLASVPPFLIAVWPAMVAGSLRLARASPTIFAYVAYFVLLVAVAHLPLAFFGTVATQRQLGTYLDVHTIDFVAQPLTRVPTELEPGSSGQLVLLIWLPLLLVWPAFCTLTAGSVGFVTMMAQRQQAANRRERT